MIRPRAAVRRALVLMLAVLAVAGCVPESVGARTLGGPTGSVNQLLV